MLSNSVAIFILMLKHSVSIVLIARTEIKSQFLLVRAGLVHLTQRHKIFSFKKCYSKLISIFCALWKRNLFIAFIASLVKLTKREIAILKFNAAVIITSCEVIIASLLYV